MISTDTHKLSRIFCNGVPLSQSHSWACGKKVKARDPRSIGHASLMSHLKLSKCAQLLGSLRRWSQTALSNNNCRCEHPPNSPRHLSLHQFYCAPVVYLEILRGGGNISGVHFRKCSKFWHKNKFFTLNISTKIFSTVKGGHRPMDFFVKVFFHTKH